MVDGDASTRRHLLVVHQGGELYGSDRSMLELLAGLDLNLWRCTVCLHEAGPLQAELEALGPTVRVLPLVKVSRAMFSPRGLLALPGQVLRALRALDAVAGPAGADLVYTNTLAVWAGALWARRRGRPHVWHVREIIRRPAWVGWGLRALSQRLATRLVCNSEQTRAWLDAGVPLARQHSVVVWNGIEADAPPSAEERRAARHALGIHDDRPLLLLVGRVNHWKGQDLLLDAVDGLCTEGAPPLALALVGGPPPGQPQWMDALRARVAVSPCAADIQVHEFTPDVRRFYAAADVLVVPSREPEPFGRVAVEGMAVGLPVVAARYGGLAEIVEHQVTGLLVPPNDAAALACALRRLIDAPALRRQWGLAGRERQRQRFSLQACRAGVFRVFDEVLQ